MSAFAHPKDISPRRGVNTDAKVLKIFEKCKYFTQKIVEMSNVISFFRISLFQTNIFKNNLHNSEIFRIFAA